MARSRRVNDKPKAEELRPGRPYIRMPWERHRVAISWPDSENRTHESFRDECDINNIIDLHTRTGLVNHLNPGNPQYGDAPESTLFEAACAQAAIRTALEDGWTPPADDSDTGEDIPPESREAPQEASQDALDTEKGDRGGQPEL